MNSATDLNGNCIVDWGAYIAVLRQCGHVCSYAKVVLGKARDLTKHPIGEYAMGNACCQCQDSSAFVKECLGCVAPSFNGRMRA